MIDVRLVQYHTGDLHENYTENNIYYANETTIFTIYSLQFNDEMCVGGMLLKNRLTMLKCSIHQ